jgi:hypothetical protein
VALRGPRGRVKAGHLGDAGRQGALCVA